MSDNIGSKKLRPALGDMTNNPSKRGISSILGDLLLKSGDESGKTVVREDSGVKFSKRLCLVVEDLVKENSRGNDGNTGPSSSSSSCYDKNISSCPPNNEDSEHTERVNEKVSQDVSAALEVNVQSSKSDDGEAAVEIADGEEHVQTCLELGNKNYGETSNMASTPDRWDVTDEGTARTILIRDSEIRDELVMREDKITEDQELPNSENFKSFDINRCSNIDRTEHVNHGVGVDLLKSCSCSFCLKAAYIWTDLNYQDIKGRLSVLKKSQKEANSLYQRHSKGKSVQFQRAAGASDHSSKLEYDLMAQWRSLFLNMGKILGSESNHLQKSFAVMKELRDDCKMDVERATKTTHEH